MMIRWMKINLTTLIIQINLLDSQATIIVIALAYGVVLIIVFIAVAIHHLIDVVSYVKKEKKEKEEERQKRYENRLYNLQGSIIL